jgi:hypothetical protein
MTFDITKHGRHCRRVVWHGAALTDGCVLCLAWGSLQDVAIAHGGSQDPTGRPAQKLSRDWRRLSASGFEHFMTLSDNGNRQGQILRYLEAMKTASSQATAAKEAFGTDLARLGEDLEHFVWVKTRGDRNYTEYDLAVAELERLDAR